MPILTCPKCGYKGHPDEDGNCPKCGAKMEAATYTAPDKRKKCKLAGDEEKCPAAKKGYGYPKPEDKTPKAAKECPLATKYKCPYFVASDQDSLQNDDELQEEWESLSQKLAEAQDFFVAEDLLTEALSKPDADKHDEFITEVKTKVDTLKTEGRTLLIDNFSGPMELLEHGKERTRFRAVVGQINTVNKNGRLYPRKEIVRNLERINKLIEVGGFVGLADHPSLLNPVGSIKDIAVKYDKVMVRNHNIIAEGELIPTSSGREVGILWDAGVGLEWSLRGYGKLEDVTDEEGRITHSVVKDYILDGIDLVLRGASDTRTLQVTYEHQEKPARDESMENKAKTPVIDMEAVTADVKKAATDAAAEAAKAVLAEQRLADYKAEKLATVDKTYRKPIERALAGASTIEEVDSIMAEYEPLLADVFKAKQYSGFGIITERTQKQSRAEKWFLAGQFVERPETPAEVKAQLLESVEDNGKPQWNNPRNVWEAMLDTMEREHPDYFEAATKRGIQETTTTTALSPIVPVILPMMRQLFPQLIPFEISSVQPLKAPTGRVYWLKFTNDSGQDLSDSTVFDSTWADHTEGEDKSEISFDLDYTDVSAKKKAISYQVTSDLIQDLKALHNLDAEAELINAAVDQIAREINESFLEMIRAGATAASLNFGTNPPSGSNYTGKEWRNVLIDYLAEANGYVSERVHNTPDWIVAGPGAAPLLETLQTFNANPTGGVRKFGKGLTLVGSLSSWNVYKADWFSRNTLLLGYKPPTWSDTGAVYAPYVTLYVSPREYAAVKDIAKRSVSSRFAMEVLRGDAFATITVMHGSEGTEPFSS